MQRTAPEGGKAGAKDNPRIDQIGIVDDFLIAHLLGLADQRICELAPQSLQLKAIKGDLRLALFWPAVLPDIEALAGLLAELAGRHHRLEPAAALRRHAHDAPDLNAYVEAHRIGKLDWPHRHSKRARRFVDLLPPFALLDPEQRLRDVGGQHAVDEEART